MQKNITFVLIHGKVIGKIEQTGCSFLSSSAVDDHFNNVVNFIFNT